jgi:hypothetical protein
LGRSRSAYSGATSATGQRSVALFNRRPPLKSSQRQRTDGPGLPDRAEEGRHRYRLVSKGTIEKRILERQRVNRSMAEQVIGAEAAGFEELTKEELLGLFRLLAGDGS